MPRYDYKCNTCDVKEEVTHGMESFEDMSEEQVNLLRCKNKDCANFGEIMSRDWSNSNISLGGSSGGTMMSEKQLMHQKQASRKLRSKKHFKREVLPTLNETPKITKHFNDKFKDI